ncbi:DUF1990 family protein [Amycolatopsis deserti]|uniref:DUF1990 family protein n=1 Tax=Amycolatopsis deserti TaxID=185696 RepID=UPI001749C75C|nr:DUF1990 domain-containing protein [Amycolatopsis deserti]
MLDGLRGAPFSYAEVGRTRGELPPGYRHLRRRAVVGRGRDRFEEAARILLGWGVQRGAGLRVHPSGEVVSEGALALLRAGLAPVRITAPVRVVYVVDERERRGFAYGTLPGHPVAGEEAFVVELGPDETVTFTITAFSRPASLLARLAGPVGRAVQYWMTGRYLRALRA